MERHISEKDLNENISRITEQCRKISTLYKRGYMTDDEKQRELSYLFFDGLRAFLREHGIYLRISAANWADFLRDYQLWAEKQPALPEEIIPLSDKEDGQKADEKSRTSSETAPWLCLRKERISGGTEYGTEASPPDKAAFFSLMQTFCLEPGFYEPLGEGTAEPAILMSSEGSYDLNIGGTDVWQDDGGLLSETFRLGDTIVLTDRYGLKAKIQVTEAIPDKGIFKKEADFIGTGFVEGYTTERPREIRIRLTEYRPARGYPEKDGTSAKDDPVKRQVFSLEFAADADDKALFRDFPLWQEWHRLQDRKNEQYDAAMNRIIEKY